jgi:hypothetical protein
MLITRQIVVKGPSVSGGETTLEVVGQFDLDNTLLVV